MTNIAKVRSEYELKKIELAEQEMLEAAKSEMSELKAVRDEETIGRMK
jgi:hypothetical protein